VEEHRTRDAVSLTNRVVIEVHTASFRAVRGYTVVGCIADEIAFWRSEESANPDTEILNGLRPGQYTLYGDGTNTPYYWVWVPSGVTAPSPPPLRR